VFAHVKGQRDRVETLHDATFSLPEIFDRNPSDLLKLWFTVS
jgi:hypothetical protein